MGCYKSKVASPYENNLTLLKLKPTLEALQFTEKEVAELYSIFRQVDKDGSGSIGLQELMNYVEIGTQQKAFRDRIFSIFDSDGSGTIDFREFALALWNYCTLGKNTLDMFAFDLYDADNTGLLSADELYGMLEDIYGHSLERNNNAKMILMEFKEKKQDNIDIETFQKFTRNHERLLFPAFELQQKIREQVLGEVFWDKAADRRIEISEGKYLSVAKFVELSTHAMLLQKALKENHLNSAAKLILQNSGQDQTSTLTAEDMSGQDVTDKIHSEVNANSRYVAQRQQVGDSKTFQRKAFDLVIQTSSPAVSGISKDSPHPSPHTQHLPKHAKKYYQHLHDKELLDTSPSPRNSPSRPNSAALKQHSSTPPQAQSRPSTAAVAVGRGNTAFDRLSPQRPNTSHGFSKQSHNNSSGVSSVHPHYDDGNHIDGDDGDAVLNDTIVQHNVNKPHHNISHYIKLPLLTHDKPSQHNKPQRRITFDHHHEGGNNKHISSSHHDNSVNETTPKHKHQQRRQTFDQ